MHTSPVDAIMDPKMKCPHLSKVEHIIMAQIGRLKVLLEVEGDHFQTVFAFRFHTTINPSLPSPGNDGSLKNKRNKIIVPIRRINITCRFFTSGNYNMGNKVNMLNMPGVGLNKVNRMLPPCLSSYCHKQTLHRPDGHSTPFLTLISPRDLSLLQ